MSKRDATWISDWRPDDESFWDAKGKVIARRNLIWSILAEHIGFSVWLISCGALTWWYYLRRNFLAQRAPTNLAEARV